MFESTGDREQGRRLRLGAAVGIVIAVAAVTFLAGLGWGWQVQHDKTIVWTLAQHILFLMLMSFFGV
jgi:thiol:disulfide interchange protein